MRVREGQRIAIRRKAVGWKRQTDLAAAVPTSLSTIVRAENDDPSVSRAMKAAIWRAIEKEEAARGIVTSPDQPVRDDAPSMKEGANAAQTRQRMRLEGLELALSQALEIVRRGLAEYAEADDQKRKSG